MGASVGPDPESRAVPSMVEHLRAKAADRRLTWPYLRLLARKRTRAPWSTSLLPPPKGAAVESITVLVIGVAPFVTLALMEMHFRRAARRRLS